MGQRSKVPVEDLDLVKRGASVLTGNTFRDSRTVFVVPTLGMIAQEVVEAWMGLLRLPNQQSHWLFVKGDEVAEAYNRAIKEVLLDPVISTWPYVMTLEDDNLPPPDAFVRLCDTIQRFKLDGVAGLYYQKGEDGMPLILGNARRFRETGVLDFTPQDPVECAKYGQIIECNAVPMGCTIWRMELFREFTAPWFRTVSAWDQATNATVYRTQDCAWCERVRQEGKRVAVDLRVRVGHIDKQGVLW